MLCGAVLAVAALLLVHTGALPAMLVLLGIVGTAVTLGSVGCLALYVKNDKIPSAWVVISIMIISMGCAMAIWFFA